MLVWRHLQNDYLIRWHFEIITDQKTVTFMFNTGTINKIKNDKIADGGLNSLVFPLI